MTDELIEMAQGQGCSPAFVEFKQLPVTFSHIALAAGLAITDPQRQTGPNYAANDRNDFDLTVETGSEGTAITFYYPLGGTNAEVIFDAPKYRSNSRHIINASINFSPGDYRPPTRNRHASMFIGDMGCRITSTDDSEMTEKYGTMALRRRRWGYNNRTGFASLGYQIQTQGGIDILYAWNKDEHVFGWRTQHSNTTVIPFFGGEKPTRIEPIFEARFPYDEFKRMLNRAGRAQGKGGALYWSYNPSAKQFYVIGAYSDGTTSLEGSNYSVPIWTKNGLDEITSGTIPYRPFGEAIVNRYKAASHVGIGKDSYGRMYISAYYDWGYIRYNHISFGHGLIHRAIAEGGRAKVTEGEKPSFFENFDLTFEYSPYNEEEENFLNKWYKSYIMQQESQVSRPILPKKGEILQWYVTYCQYAEEVTDEDEKLARKILS